MLQMQTNPCPPVAAAAWPSPFSSYQARLSDSVESVSALPTLLIKTNYKCFPLVFLFEDSGFSLLNSDTLVFGFKPKYLQKPDVLYRSLCLPQFSITSEDALPHGQSTNVDGYSSHRVCVMTGPNQVRTHTAVLQPGTRFIEKCKSSITAILNGFSNPC